jgi:hypothetical protein
VLGATEVRKGCQSLKQDEESVANVVVVGCFKGFGELAAEKMVSVRVHGLGTMGAGW